MKNIFFISIILVIFSNSCATINHINPYPNIKTLQYGGAKAYLFENTSSDKLIINIEGSGWTSVLGSKGQHK